MKTLTLIQKLGFLLFFVLASLTGFGQVDKTFWFAAPDIQQFVEPNYLRVTSFNKEATVTITQPANPGFVPIVQKVAANSSYTFDLTNFTAAIESDGADIITNKGLLITATEKIMAYYEPAKDVNPDIYALKGSNALGTDFIITSQKKWASYQDVPSSFYVVATEDNTTINITPSVDLVGHSKTDGSYTKVLNKGQVYVADAVSNLGLSHVGGSIVTSDKPIAVTMANDLVSPPGGCGDQNGDQLVSSSVAGTEFITLPGGLNVDGITDLVYIYPIADNTTISVNGISVGNRNRGEFYEVANTGQTLNITTDRPVMIYQLGGFGCEVGGAVIPTVTCTGSTTVGLVRSTSESFTLLLLVKTGGEGTFRFNGSTTVVTSADFSDVPTTNGEWKFARISLDETALPAAATATVKNVVPFHLGVINGGTSGGTRYGYFSSFSGFEPDVFLTPNTYGDLYTDVKASSYQWYRNDVLIPGAILPTYSATQSGNYSVEVSADAACPKQRSEKIGLGLTPASVGIIPALWLRADKEVTSSANQVSAWLDQSGNDNHHSQSASDKKPGYNLVDANFNPTLTFSGTQWIEDANGIFDSSKVYNESQVFITHNSTTLTGGASRGLYGQYVKYGNDLDARFMAHGDFDDGSQYFGLISYNSDASWVTLPSSAARLDAYVLNSYRMADGEHSLWFNGGDITTAKTLVRDFKSFDPSKPFTVGAAPAQVASGSSPYAFTQKGSIPEIIVFTSALNEVARFKVETYLALKYGNTLSHNYFNTTYDGTNAAATTVYNISSYPANIAGIARDDKADIYQKQSRSQNSIAYSRMITMGVGGIAASNALNTSNFDNGLYMVWGDDNDAVTETTVEGIKRIAREWKMQVTGKAPANVEVNFNLQSLTFSAKNIADYKLVIDRDGDGDFTTGKLDRYDADAISSLTSVTFKNVQWDADGSGTDVFTLQTSPSCTTVDTIVYNGSYFASTTNNSAIVTLSATVKVPSPFDARNVTVKFVNRETGTFLTDAIKVGLVSNTDLSIGTATANVPIALSSSEDARQLSVGMVVEGVGICTRDNANDDALVVVAKPLNDFVTGGGYLLMSKSAGLYAGTAGTKNNFGYNVKFNRRNTTLQGSFTTIIRRLEKDGKTHLYQVKASSFTSLSANNATSVSPAKGTFSAKASIRDISIPKSPIVIDASATLQVVMTDMGEPGKLDQLSIAVWNKNGGLWFTSNWDGLKSNEQIIYAGNIQVNQPSTVTGSVNNSLQLISSNLNANAGQSISFTGTVTESDKAIPTGYITFFDETESKVLGYVQLKLSNSATFSTSNLSVGTHKINAFYAGDTKFKPATSTALTQVISLATGISRNSSSISESLATPAGLQVKVFGNPSSTAFKLALVSGNLKQSYLLTVMDASGRKIQMWDHLNTNDLIEVGHNYRPGIYFATFISGGYKKQVRLVKVK